MSKTIIVSNRLPIKITEDGNGYALHPSEGGLATGLASIHALGENTWVGWPGIILEDAKQKAYFTKVLKEKRLAPIFLDDDEIRGFYEGFSNEVLWPIFHYMPNYAIYELENWETYVRVNEKFRDLVLEVAEPNDTIWVHDYQLLLLPGLLRSALPDASIGFFQHIPFPSQELFRLIPWRRELLEGMLGADLLGFHTFDDVRHFISSATRLVGTNNNSNKLEEDGRTIVVESFPMGIDSNRFSTLSSDSKVLKRVAELKSNFKNQKIILSIDRLDYSKGILQRLEAFDLFLAENPDFHKQVTLYMVVVPSRDTVPQYRELKDQIDRLVGNINAEYGVYDWYPVAYFYHGYPAEEIAALYNVADVCLVTPMRDGMNLVSKEYVASRHDHTGVLILSEMAGAANELIDALIVNPNNVNDIRDALLTALRMPATEVTKRMNAMRQIVFKFTVQHWATLFMSRLEEIKKVQSNTRARLVGPVIEDQIISGYSAAASRLLLLDYDGTLVGFQDDIDKASPDDELYRLLDILEADINNHLVIISGRKHSTLEQWFQNKPYSLIAEHGVWTKEPHAEWHLKSGLSNTWKEEVGAFMESYADRTPGAFVEEKSFSLAWHYRKVQRDLGALRAQELIEGLRDYSASYGLQLLDGDKVVEIRSAEVNKGRATLDILHENRYDFILSIGDDRTDEDTFHALPREAFTIKVGTEVSAARFYLKHRREVRMLLQKLADIAPPTTNP
ncbi:bifunctional alpha,alpha-trehalose-phosphate synthase (UDP-forming)/trehalose-phosphatase [Parapedobacter sp. 10938]|uniref:bifunctional alpha,alpha-trehalose-phosphate synthase (UDP-forming)/trehalose-phosphatase n=1 Tax=Parapedobacter flavus TaxID=3110225 RepID=UPI002DBF0F9F|nr:bifunctional alpha,alpha-trehalose-phosphate synthase (UDP-forming)/trehalose-phosphatase [Parapedobacter sp. 10938]MEC3880640.1 bifunctional alpha,alpha-trehalose-phosphate synthase (UDP-forming)/trehalose-phosphatase [Parapedobacter sp. 10938]